MKKNNFQILVTGGSGYVGSRVAKKLFDLGYSVSIIDKVSPSQRRLSLPQGINVIVGDLRDRLVTQQVLKNIDLVVHLAANIGSLAYMNDHQAEILQENTAIDATLYPALIDANVKTIIYSSSSMVFQKSTIYPYREEDALRIHPPTNVYGMSKLIGEYFCRAYHEQYGLSYVIMRYHNIYGEGEDSKGSTPGDIHVIPALIEKVLKGQYPLEILGNPDATRPFVYIDDAVEATIKLIEAVTQDSKRVINEDFNIGSDKAIKILDLAKLIWKISGDRRPFKYRLITTTAITADKREMYPTKIKKIVGWKPDISLEEGIKKVFQWLRYHQDH